jgi:hypothetical protein
MCSVREPDKVSLPAHKSCISAIMIGLLHLEYEIQLNNYNFIICTYIYVIIYLFVYV